MNREERRRLMEEFLARDPVGADGPPQERSAWLSEASRVYQLIGEDVRADGDHELASYLDWVAQASQLEARRAVRGLN